jgi:hypothetical protein
MRPLKALTKRRNGGGSRHEPTEPPVKRSTSSVLDLEARRIEKALDQRTRYKYVHPRVVREGKGWKVVSPNCSRNIDRDGGEIDIAWLVPNLEGGWLLYSRDHSQACWQLRLHAHSLPALLDHLCADPDREYWQ